MLQEAKSLDVNTSQKQKLVHRKGPFTSTTIPFDEPTIASRNSLAILVSLMNGGVDNA
jgi:hypothetical protein